MFWCYVYINEPEKISQHSPPVIVGHLAYINLFEALTLDFANEKFKHVLSTQGIHYFMHDFNMTCEEKPYIVQKNNNGGMDRISIFEYDMINPQRQQNIIVHWINGWKTSRYKDGTKVYIDRDGRAETHPQIVSLEEYKKTVDTIQHHNIPPVQRSPKAPPIPKPKDAIKSMPFSNPTSMTVYDKSWNQIKDKLALTDYGWGKECGNKEVDESQQFNTNTYDIKKMPSYDWSTTSVSAIGDFVANNNYFESVKKDTEKIQGLSSVYIQGSAL